MIGGRDCPGCGLANHASWCPEAHPTAVLGDWVGQGNCDGVDMFPITHRDTIRAKEVCLKCPVSRACLQHACATPEREGIWGASTPAERQVLGRKPTAERITRHFQSVTRRLGVAR